MPHRPPRHPGSLSFLTLLLGAWPLCATAEPAPDSCAGFEAAAANLNLPRHVSLDLADGSTRAGMLTRYSANEHLFVLNPDNGLRQAEGDAIPTPSIRRMRIGERQFHVPLAWAGAVAGTFIAIEIDKNHVNSLESFTREWDHMLIGAALGFVIGGVAPMPFERIETIEHGAPAVP